MEQAQQAIPKSRNNDKVPRHKLAVICDNGYKGFGVVDYEEDELVELLSNEPATWGAWLTIRTVSYEERDGRGTTIHYDTEILRVKRANIVAWAISPIRKPSELLIARKVPVAP